MTMFSMKPKFDLAEFLAEPASARASSRRKFYRTPQAAPSKATPDEDQDAASSDD